MRRRSLIWVGVAVVVMFLSVIVIDEYAATQEQIRLEEYATGLIRQIQDGDAPIYTTAQIVTGEAPLGSVVKVSGTILVKNGDYAFINTWRPGLMQVITVDVYNMPTGTGYYPQDDITFYGMYQERQDDGDIIIRYLTR